MIGHADSTRSCVKGTPNGEVSMSTSLLDHAFGIRAYESTRTDSQDGQVIFTIHQEPKTCRCSACGDARSSRAVTSRTRFRSLPIGSRATSVVLPILRVECRACGVVRQVEIPIADPRRSVTKSFERHALGVVAEHDHPRRGPAPWASVET